MLLLRVVSEANSYLSIVAKSSGLLAAPWSARGWDPTAGRMTDCSMVLPEKEKAQPRRRRGGGAVGKSRTDTEKEGEGGREGKGGGR